jgi:ribosomal protein L16 Arg81 hydroxylase
MKELSTEQKARAYDKAKYIMKKYIESGNAGVIAENTIKNAFPELKESEDEKMKKIISDILLIDNDEIREILDANNVLMQDIDAWLEKQSIDISSFPAEQQVFMQKYTGLDKITLIKLLAERDANNAEII